MTAVRVEAGDDLRPHLVDGAVVVLGPGVHRGGLTLDASVTLRGEPGAVLDAGGRGPVVRIAANQLEVRLQGVQITGGAFDFGSGVLVEGYSGVTLDGCAIAGNARGEGHGAGLGARRGWVTVIGGRIDDDVVITGTAEVSFSGTALGDVSALEGARVTFDGGSVGTLTVRGTTTRAPTVTLDGAAVGQVRNDADLPGTVT